MRISTDLDGLLDLIHDRWFDLTECVFDQGRREFRLSLSDGRKGPYRQKLLIVADVTDVAIRDEAQIQIYDLCNVRITSSSIHMLSGMPLEIVLTIGDQWSIQLLAHPSRRSVED